MIYMYGSIFGNVMQTMTSFRPDLPSVHKSIGSTVLPQFRLLEAQGQLRPFPLPPSVVQSFDHNVCQSTCDGTTFGSSSSQIQSIRSLIMRRKNDCGRTLNDRLTLLSTATSLYHSNSSKNSFISGGNLWKRSLDKTSRHCCGLVLICSYQDVVALSTQETYNAKESCLLTIYLPTQWHLPRCPRLMRCLYWHLKGSIIMAQKSKSSAGHFDY